MPAAADPQASKEEYGRKVTSRYRYTKSERCCWLTRNHNARSPALPDSRPYLEALTYLAEHLHDELDQNKPTCDGKKAKKIPAAQNKFNTYRNVRPERVAIQDRPTGTAVWRDGPAL